ncbi:MAG: chromosomal replication initiator protein DnaA [Bacillota bacterium]|nr:chromosomal replication initiator protein DnaA [Bacillota bacterium]
MDSFEFNIHDILSKVKKILKARLAPENYNIFVRDLSVVFHNGKSITLKTQNASNVGVLENKYNDMIKEAFSEVTKRNFDIKYTHDGSEAENNSKQNTGLNPMYNFEDFVVWRGNEVAQGAASRVAQYSPELNTSTELYNPLFIYGGVGLGKTHLIQAIGNYARAIEPNSNVYYVTSETLLNEYVMAIRSGDTQNFRKKYRNLDMLLIDDIQFIVRSEQLQEELYNTFNTLKQANKRIVFASDRPPKDLVGLEERLVSRFNSGFLQQIFPPDYETRKAILLKKLEYHTIKPSDEIIDLIALNVTTNIRDLEAVLNRVILTANMTNTEPTIQIAENALRDYIDTPRKKQITIRDIKAVVADHYHVRIEEIDSQKRTKDIARARQVAVYLARQITDKSLPKLGEEFGRDHTTIHHAITKIQNDRKTDVELNQAIETLIELING